MAQSCLGNETSAVCDMICGLFFLVVTGNENLELTMHYSVVIVFVRFVDGPDLD